MHQGCFRNLKLLTYTCEMFNDSKLINSSTVRTYGFNFSSLYLRSNSKSKEKKHDQKNKKQFMKRREE